MRGIEYNIELKICLGKFRCNIFPPPVIQGTHQEAPKMASQQVTAKKQQGEIQVVFGQTSVYLTLLELQNQYSTYKNTLQQLAQKIGDVEQEAEEHKYDFPVCFFPMLYDLAFLDTQLKDFLHPSHSKISTY